MANTTVNVRHAQRHDTSDNWAAKNPVLLAGEIGVDTTVGKFKIGNGKDDWKTLQFYPISWADISGKPSAIKNPNALTVKFNNGSTEGTNSFTYDGSSVKNINITPAAIGASPTAGSTSLKQLASTITLGDGNGATIDQAGGQYRQRIEIVDDSTAGSSVFRFSQSSNNGSSYTTLFDIHDDGNVVATKFSGSGASLTSLNASNISSGTLASDRLPVVPVSKGGTGLSSLTAGQVLIGNGTSNVAFRPIDTTSGGTSGSNNLITSGAVFAGLAGKAPTSHTHSKTQITDFPTSLKNPNALTISLNGTSQGAYDGSAAKSINITAASVGASASNHTHSNYVTIDTAQTISGAKTFSNVVTISNTTAATAPTTGALKVAGGVGVNGRVSAKEVMVGNGCVLQYSSDDKCLNFVFA